MKHPFVLAVLAVTLILTACRSYGPRFDARDPRSFTNSVTKPGVAPTNIATLGDEDFSVDLSTNRLPAAWLQPPKDFYRLGPGDSVDIEALGDAAANASVVVGPDGKIYYGLLPGTFVWGLTLTEVKDALEKGLKKYLRTVPDITVNLKGVSSQTVWLLGNVNSPGVYALSTPLTVLDAISQAGGVISPPGSVDGICDLQRSFIMRKGKLVPVDFERLLRNGDLSQNIYLQANDFIYLRSGLIRNVYVMGAVGSPGVLPYADGLTVLSAVAGTGGTVPYAQGTKVAIIRGSLANPRVAVVDYKEIIQGRNRDVRLAAGDIVYVPFSPWRKVGMLAESMLNQFVTTMAANEGSRAFGGGVAQPYVPVGPPVTK